MKHLVDRAEHVARRFPEIDVLEDHFVTVLLETLDSYNAAKPWTFDRLFEHNLGRRLRRERRRASKRAKRTAARLRHIAEQRRRTRDELTATKERWYRYLLAWVYPHLNPEVRMYIDGRRTGCSMEEIAKELGTTKTALNNRFGGHRVGRFVQPMTHGLVKAMPEEHRRLWVRHLLDEAGLQADEVRHLLGVEPFSDDAVPVLEEGPMLAVLGWSDENSTSIFQKSSESLAATDFLVPIESDERASPAALHVFGTHSQTTQADCTGQAI